MTLPVDPPVDPPAASPAHPRGSPAELAGQLAVPSITDGEWHRLHPATPLLRGGIFIIAVLGFVIANLRERLVELFFNEPNYGGDPIDEIVNRGAVGWALLVVAGILIVILVVFTLSWRMHTFRVTAEVVEVRSGVVFRSSRRARLDRVQGVNLVRPFLPRLFGAARLEVSVAGQDGNVQLAYLNSALADGLRRDILRLAVGLRHTPPVATRQSETDAEQAAAQAVDGRAVVARGPSLSGVAQSRVNEFLAPELDPDAAPPESVVRIPAGRLIGSLIFSGFTVFLLIAAVGLIVSVAAGSSQWLLFAILPGIIASFGYYFSRFTKSLRYSIAGTTEGVRVGFGLLSTSSETLPAGRIHAIGVSQPLLWRPFGWWQVQINKAGQSTNQGAAGAANTMTLPVGTLADVARVLELVVPGFATEEHRSLIERGLTSRGGDDGFTNAPRSARWLRPFSWRRTGYAVRDHVALLRRGVIARELVLVPLARLQSVRISQGPLQRRLGLANAALHTVAGPVAATLGVIDRNEAVRLFEAVAREAVISADLDTNETPDRGSTVTQDTATGTTE
ncbi:PH domain-containing protein [Cryobacterium sp. MLB-32]|uniref:PH domain-containing protein n=1 Tax=Cryobacterium sp. MLB-32 TaxID=1529318 RepID=UPI001E53C672|nr:PH domain-containing protein [Cryobacterium sp. MLB-32]